MKISIYAWSNQQMTWLKKDFSLKDNILTLSAHLAWKRSANAQVLSYPPPPPPPLNTLLHEMNVS